MDSILLLLEPQIAIPVVGVVVCAVLVYIFGFQQTQEPSFQHLAILQSSGKSKTANGVASKPSKPAPSPRTTTKAKEKPMSNGNVVHGSSGKENVKPQQQPTTPKGKKEKNPGAGAAQQVDDAGEGDWIQAVSRKDKKKVVRKEENKPAAVAATEKKAARVSPPPASKPRPILEEIALRAQLEQNTSTKKEEEKKVMVKEERPAKAKAELKVQEVEAVINKKEESKQKEAPKPAPAEDTDAKPKEAPKPAVEAKQNADPKSNVAFDEVGDLWEEAKSRGAKKKRVRKD